AFGGDQRRRKSHLRRSASSRVTSRSGRATASGIPGEPPPEPTSTTAPSYRSRSGAARSASSSNISRAWSRSASAVSPGVATTALSQSLRNDDDVAVRLHAFGSRPDAGDVLQVHVDDLALDRRHRLELLALAGFPHPIGNP